jgi:hypothetical protein
MDRLRLFRPVCLIFLAASAACLAAQVPAFEEHLKPVPPPRSPAPFQGDTAAQNTADTVEFLPSEAMTKADKLLAANAESSIAEHSARTGIDFTQGGWSYQQVVCPALPNHLFLQYAREAGTASETLFSASIPRNGDGRVRIIPIRRRGYSLFSPAPINALTISAFNHIRAEEPESQRAQSWLGNGLCYAALAGAHPHLPDSGAEPRPGHPVPALGAFLDVKDNDGEVIRFADEAAKPRPMIWEMTFSQKGKLLKATHGPAALYEAHPVPKNMAATPPRPVPAAK